MTYQPEVWWNWIYDKTRISEITGLSDDSLHVHFGLAILFLAALVLRRLPWNWRPWLVVVALETANEAYDLLQPWYSTDEGNFAGAWHDYWPTILWPTVILLTVPWFLRQRDRRAARIKASEDERASESADVGTDIVA